MPRRRRISKRKSGSKYKGMGKTGYMAWVRSHRKIWMNKIKIK